MKPATCPTCGGNGVMPITRAELMAVLVDGADVTPSPCEFCNAGKTALFIHRGKYYTAEAAKLWQEKRKERKP